MIAFTCWATLRGPFVLRFAGFRNGAGVRPAIGEVAAQYDGVPRLGCFRGIRGRRLHEIPDSPSCPGGIGASRQPAPNTVCAAARSVRRAPCAEPHPDAGRPNWQPPRRDTTIQTGPLDPARNGGAPSPDLPSRLPESLGVPDIEVGADPIHRQKGLNPSVCIRKAQALMWGSLASCGRLSIGQMPRLHRTAAVANRPQPASLPHITPAIPLLCRAPSPADRRTPRCGLAPGSPNRARAKRRWESGAHGGRRRTSCTTAELEAPR